MEIVDCNAGTYFKENTINNLFPCVHVYSRLQPTLLMYPPMLVEVGDSTCYIGLNNLVVRLSGLPLPRTSAFRLHHPVSAQSKPARPIVRPISLHHQQLPHRRSIKAQAAPPRRQGAHPRREADCRCRCQKGGRLQPRTVEEQRRVGEQDRLVRRERGGLALPGAHVRLAAPLPQRERAHQVPHDGQFSRRPHSRGRSRHEEAVREHVDHHRLAPRPPVRHPGTPDPPQACFDPRLTTQGYLHWTAWRDL